MRKAFGYIPEPPNPKHWKTERVYGAAFSTILPGLGVDLGKPVDMRELSPVRHDQGEAGTCVANAAAKAVEVKTLRETGSYKDLSRLAIYFLARELMVPSRTQEDYGTYISLGFDAIRRFGAPLEKDWPYHLQKLYTSPDWGVMLKAHKNRLDGFFKLESGGDELLKEVHHQLSLGRPVVFGTGVDKSLLRYRKGQTLHAPLEAAIEGYHAMTILGWTGSQWIIENSWGPDWGDNGFALADKDYLLGETASEFWITTLPFEGVEVQK